MLTPEKFTAATGNLSSTATQTNAPAGTNITSRIIRTGTTISITVDEDRSLSRTYTVPGSGAIEYQPLGRIMVEGLTPEEVAQTIKQALERDYFQKATVNVSIEAMAGGGGGGGVIYVLGAVNRPGPLLLPKDERFTVTKAIIAAGGLSMFGNGAKVQLIRYDEAGKKYKTFINVDRIMKRGEFEKDVPLQNGDWIIVAEKLVNF